MVISKCFCTKAYPFLKHLKVVLSTLINLLKDKLTQKCIVHS